MTLSSRHYLILLTPHIPNILIMKKKLSLPLSKGGINVQEKNGMNGHAQLTEDEMKKITNKVNNDIIKETKDFLEKERVEALAWRK